MRLIVVWIFLMAAVSASGQQAETVPYQNHLSVLKNPQPLLTDYPEYFEPITEATRFEAPAIVNDVNADLQVRAWRFSYNARGIIEMPNFLSARETAVTMVHPWAIDDSWGWKTPRPNGVADFCTPVKNALAAKHTKEVVDPFLKGLRSRVARVMYSLPGPADPIRTQVYRSFSKTPTAAERVAGEQDLPRVLAAFDYSGMPLPETLTLGKSTPVIDDFKLGLPMD